MSDLISKQRAIEAIDKFIPADPMMSDYTQGISVGLAIATRCIEEFSQENAESSQGLVKDLISRQDAIDVAMEYGKKIPPYAIRCKQALKDLPSVEPETPSNGSITCVKPEKMHDRTMGDLISRQDAIDIIQMNRDEEAKKSLSADAKHKSVIRSKHDAHVAFCDYLIEAVKELPSAEKTQLSGEDATSVCKCPCVYREPCDVCHYDGHLGMGCPAEEGMKDE